MYLDRNHQAKVSCNKKKTPRVKSVHLFPNVLIFYAHVSRWQSIDGVAWLSTMMEAPFPTAVAHYSRKGLQKRLVTVLSNYIKNLGRWYNSRAFHCGVHHSPLRNFRTLKSPDCKFYLIRFRNNKYSSAPGLSRSITCFAEYVFQAELAQQNRFISFIQWRSSRNLIMTYPRRLMT